MPEIYITSRELARRYSLCPETPRIWRQRRQGPRFVRIAGSIRYAESAVAEWVAAQNVPADLVEV